MFQALIHLLLNIAANSADEGTPYSPCNPPLCSESFKDVIRVKFKSESGSLEVRLTNLSFDTIMVQPKFLDTNGNKKNSVANISWVPANIHSESIRLPGEASDQLLLTLSRNDTTINTPYPIIEYDFILGDPGAIHTPNHYYKIPFAQGKKFKVTQGFEGSTSHNVITRKHAIDIEMPIGTTICACRAGKVVDVVEKFPDTSTTMAETNYIRILHSDGTYGIYAHLTQNGSDVDIGADVSEGGIIGRSGNSGESSAPHLHFAVAKSNGHVLATIPWKFKDSTGTQISWKVNQDLEHN